MRAETGEGKWPDPPEAGQGAESRGWAVLDCWARAAAQTHLQSREQGRGTRALQQHPPSTPALCRANTALRAQNSPLTEFQDVFEARANVLCPLPIPRHRLCMCKRRSHKYASNFLRAAPQIPQRVHFIQFQGICQTREYYAEPEMVWKPQVERDMIHISSSGSVALEYVFHQNLVPKLLWLLITQR